MHRLLLTVLLLCIVALPVHAHFIFIVPDGDTKAKVVFSDSLEPDEGVPIKNIAGTKLRAAGGEGVTASVEMKPGEHEYSIELPAGVKAIGGECKYGLLKRGEAPAFMLNYYPKMVRDDIASAPNLNLPLEIVQTDGKFRVLFRGKPVAGAEVQIIAPDSKGPLKTNDNGEFAFDISKPELYGVRARHIEKTSGEYDGKKYEEARYYATLTFRVSDKKEEPVILPPLPQAVASFGADATGGWLYVYGGHCAKTHSYSTEAVCGTFHRLNLAAPAKWEALPGGPGLQGLSLVAHGGKLYRIGGMEPRNKPGEKADNHSIASCACFDPAKGTWSPLPDLPAARSSHDAVVVGDQIVVVGGWKLNGAGKEPDWHETALILDLKADKLAWETVPQPFKRRALAAASFNGKVYVLGGIAEDNQVERTVEVFDPSTGKWTSGPKLPGPDRNGFGPAAYAAAGRLHVTLADGRVMRLATAGDAWEEVTRLKQPRIVGRMVAWGGRLVVLGGAMKGENIALTEVLP